MKVQGKNTYYWFIKNTTTGEDEEDVYVRQYLPPEYCEQHLVANLALSMKVLGKYDYVDLFTDPNRTDFHYVNRYLGFREEKRGHVFHAIEVDTLVQVQTINDISLNGEYIDTNIAVIMQWSDRRLRWLPDNHGEIRIIRATTRQVWIPDVDVVNRIHDFSPVDEK